MSGALHLRVDDRLVHGQVLLRWIPALRVERLMLVDERLVTDGLRASALRAAAEGLPLWMGAAEEAAAWLTRTCRTVDGEPPRTLLLAASVSDAALLVDHGSPLKALELGCISHASGRRRLGRQVWLTAGECATLLRLEQGGVAVTIRALPDERAVPLSEALRARGLEAWARRQAEARA